MAEDKVKVWRIVQNSGEVRECWTTQDKIDRCEKSYGHSCELHDAQGSRLSWKTHPIFKTEFGPACTNYFYFTEREAREKSLDYSLNVDYRSGKRVTLYTNRCRAARKAYESNLAWVVANLVTVALSST